MSRSNPNEAAANPCTRWFEWNGDKGVVRYYDKTKKENVEVGNDFTFIVLDQLVCIGGYNERRKCGMYSNEVRSTNDDSLLVKWFDTNEVVAQGLYADIKVAVNSFDGGYSKSVYLAYTDESGKLAIGNMRMKGAALGSWFDFDKKNRDEIGKKAVRLHGSTTAKNGRVEYHIPTFKIRDLSEETNAEATELDRHLQDFLKKYLAKANSGKRQSDGPPDDEDRTDYSQENKGEQYGQRNERESRPLPTRTPKPPHDPDLDIDGDDIPFG